MSFTANPMEAIQRLIGYVGVIAEKSFLVPGGPYAATSLLTALIISGLFLLLRRKPGRRRIRFSVLTRALLPRSWYGAPSTLADLRFLLFNIFLFSCLFGWALIGSRLIADTVGKGLEAVFGVTGPSVLPEPMAMALVTLVLFLAYELAYWLDHYLSHSIPLLWEFHKVHHAAEVLTPATNARVHPVDSIIFNNIVAIVMGLAGGIAYYLLGRKVQHFVIWDGNAIALVFAYLLTHLQHSHMWIAFTGIWGRLFLSPAHHQIHHSMNPTHFNKNMGGSLAIFDWLFGTLHIPAAKREKLSFGIEPGDMDPHSFTDSMIAPLRNATRLLLPESTPDKQGVAAQVDTRHGTQPT